MSINKLHEAKNANDFTDFLNHIRPFSKDLEKFITVKLKNAEHHHLLPKNFYDAEGILEDTYLAVFDNFNSETDEKKLKKVLFQNAIKIFNEILEKENRMRKSIPVSMIVKEELDLLKEDFSVDGNGHLVMIDELPDISYHQKDFKPKHYIIDPDAEKEIVSSLQLDDNILKDENRREKIANTYFLIPPTSKSIFELYVFGNQSEEDIAAILEIEQDQVKTVISSVVEKFKTI